MFEAVGLRRYDDFFSACQRLLTDDGAMLMQTITVDDWRFADYLGTPSWIAKRIFPGAELASVAEILSVAGPGFDERLIRMWDLYLGFCEAAFAGRHCGDMQLVFTKPACRIGTLNRHRSLGAGDLRAEVIDRPAQALLE